MWPRYEKSLKLSADAFLVSFSINAKIEFSISAIMRGLLVKIHITGFNVHLYIPIISISIGFI